VWIVLYDGEEVVDDGLGQTVFVQVREGGKTAMDGWWRLSQLVVNSDV